MENAEERVAKFYNTVGWDSDGEITEDARRWEDLREHAKEYVSKCRLRVLRHIPDNGLNILDMASGPIQYKEYLEFSRNFKRRYCVDLSKDALEKAKKKIGDHGMFLHGSFFDIPLEENFFDCVISLHTIYHIDKDKQEEAVRKLVKVVKPGKPVIIVYNNPDSLDIRLVKFAKFLLKRNVKTKKTDDSVLYFASHAIKWWDRFKDVSEVKILPWRSFNSHLQKRFFPDNNLGSYMFKILFKLEDNYPNFFAKYFTYPMIILTKK